MTDFKTVTLTQQMLDPTKRVNYTTGLVLGVDEFEQEQLYFIERDRLHNRALHGYGTICGLQVSIDADAPSGPDVVVAPGLAVNPQGQEIRVPLAQCAHLNTWLAQPQNQAEILGSPQQLKDRLLHVILCYRECETDTVPIPGEPCRTQEDSMAPSRLADNFELLLSVTPPDQTEEAVVRRFGDLLCQIVLTNEPDTVGRAEMANRVRDLASESPADEPILLEPDEADDILQHAFKVWTTEVRPTLLSDGANCASVPPEEGCVLLATLQFDITPAGSSYEVDGPIEIIENARPYLLHTRLLQEWLLCGRLAHHRLEPPRTFATLFVLNPTTIRAWVHHPTLLTIPTAAVSAIIRDESGNQSPSLVDVTQPFPSANVFDLALDGPLTDSSIVLARFDASLIAEMTSPVRPLTEALAEVDYAYLDRQDNDLLAYLAADLPALDDLTDVEAAAPNNGQILVWNSSTSRWEPRNHRHTLNSLTDTAVQDRSDRDVLVWDAASRHWVPYTLLLDDLGDVAVSKAQKQDVLQFDGEIWGPAQLQGIQAGDAAGGDLGGTYPDPDVVGLQNNPVSNQDPKEDDVLTWQNGEWVPAEPASAPPPSLDLDDLNDVNTPSPSSGQVLIHEQGQWIAATPPAGVTDHGGLTGLDADDHPQYLTEGRADTHYSQIGHTHDSVGGDFVQIPPAAGEPYAIVAAGVFDADGNTISSYNKLEVVGGDFAAGLYLLWSPNLVFTDKLTYIVKGTMLEAILDVQPGEPPDKLPDPGIPAIFQVIWPPWQDDNGDPPGIRIAVRVHSIGGERNQTGFMVEISAYGELDSIIG